MQVAVGEGNLIESKAIAPFVKYPSFTAFIRSVLAAIRRPILCQLLGGQQWAL